MQDRRDIGANTEMFRAFVDRGELERAEEKRNGLVLVLAALAGLVAVLIVVWLLVG